MKVVIENLKIRDGVELKKNTSIWIVLRDTIGSIMPFTIVDISFDNENGGNRLFRDDVSPYSIEVVSRSGMFSVFDLETIKDKIYLSYEEAKNSI